MATPLNHAPWMVWLESLVGGTSRQSPAATFSPELYYCLLDELPLHLVPQAALRSLRSQHVAALRMNPACRLCRENELPAEFAERWELCTPFAPGGTIAWMRDEALDSWLPFWLGPQLEALVEAVRNGETDDVPERWRGILLKSGILIADDGDDSAERERRIRKARDLFGARGYASLPELIHPLHVAALRRYYRQKIRAGKMWLGDKQSSRRYVAHNDPVARFFHRNLCGTLSAVAGERLKPSYVYMASYLSGAELKKHTDREQCEFSVTLCLDFSPDPALETPWPIRLDTPTGTVTAYQALGDGLAYRGTRLPHYRSKLGEGETSTSIFFHYVAEDFSGSLD